MLFTGRAILAEEAERYGLVNKVVPAGRLAEETLSLAKHIAQASPLTLALGKQSFYSQAGLEETQGYRYAQEMMSLNAMSEDAQEGISAFLQKRPPNLIAAAADLNAKDNKGITALMWATLKGFADVVETLLSNGAEVNAKTTEGLTAQRMSQRIIADLKRSLGEAENDDEKEGIPRNRLARHERVFRILERAGGE